MEGRTRETMKYDVVIVGAGPSGLAAAIRLKQLAAEAKHELSVCVVEKGSEVGAHLMAGAILEPRALFELFPDAEARGAPLGTPVTSERMAFLTATTSWSLFTPQVLLNKGNRIVSLADIGRWMAKQAEALGVEIYPGFAASEILYDSGAVAGVVIGDKGVGRNGNPLPNFEPGVELRGRQTLFAEGCHGSLTQMLMRRYSLRENADPQTYGLGIKELWEVDGAASRVGAVSHTVGWPLGFSTYGGGWIYHMTGNLVSVGFVVGLDYTNPHLDPFGEFQRFKTHPAIRATLQKGKRIAYGARTISEGGFQSIPRSTFPGGLIVGDAAGLVNVPKIKGIHTAMKSGMVAAEAIFTHLKEERLGGEVFDYQKRLESSWVWDELYRVRNVRPAFRFGLLPGIMYSGIELMFLRGRAPWTLHFPQADYATLEKASDTDRLTYPKPDGKLTFDRASSVQLANTAHVENQPTHLVLKDPNVAIRVNLALYDSPETRFCPAGVFEILRDKDGTNPRLQINPANCVHCKTCDIKDPTQNITWTVPEGGGGPNYPGGM